MRTLSIFPAVILGCLIFAAPGHAYAWTLTLMGDATVDTLASPDGRSITIFSSEGGFQTSTGVIGIQKCIGADENEGYGPVFKGYCALTDQDGDTWYEYFERRSDVVPGGKGRSTARGGTGKYTDLSHTCTYEVAYIPTNDEGNSRNFATFTCDGDAPGQ